MQKLQKQLLLGASNLIGLQAAKSDGINQVLYNGAEIFTKLLSFTDLPYLGVDCNVGKGNNTSPSLVGATGVAIASTIDDYMIQLGIYNEHHLAKAGCALYTAYKLTNNGLQGYSDASPVAIAFISAGLLGSSYLFGSGDIIHTMRTNTKDCIEFSNKISDLTEGVIDPYKDMQVAASINTIVGGGRQFLGDYKLDMGGPINGVVSAMINTGVNVASSAQTEKSLQNYLISTFQDHISKLTTEQMNALKQNAHAAKVLESLPSYIKLAASSVTKTATNSGVKTAYQQILSGSAYDQKGVTSTKFHDVGFNVFAASMLFNKVQTDDLSAKLKSIVNDFDFRNAVHKNDKYTLQASLEDLRVQNDNDWIKPVWSCTKKVANLIAPALINSTLVAGMYEKDMSTATSTGIMKEFYTPVAATLAIGESFVGTDSYDAINQLEYLLEAIAYVTVETPSKLDS